MGEGTYLFGDRTLQQTSSVFEALNVRRLFLTIEKNIKLSSKRMTFEFNDNFTRSRFVSSIDPYLRTVQGRRGIDRYTIVCDDSNNTPNVINAGEFVASIYVVPVRSINFIELNFIANNANGITITTSE